jgi:sugar phosphate isomerase/epimerase
MLTEIRRAGFEDVELSFNLTADMVAQVAAESQRGRVRVRSLHNYCPVPDGIARHQALPDCLSIASLDEREREQAVYFARRTIDTARALNARAVVLHCGRVDGPDPTHQMCRLLEQDAGGSAEYVGLRDEAVRERGRRAPEHLSACLKSLEALEQHARAAGVYLGVETRYYFFEIPSLEETRMILDRFRGSHLGYWHDTGHAQVKEYLGFSRHTEYLEVCGRELLGVHLHDVLGHHDHRAPQTGKFDFVGLRSYLTRDTLKVIEVHYPATADEIQRGRAYLEKVFEGLLEGKAHGTTREKS